MAPHGHVDLAQFGHLLADDFAPVLTALAVAHGDAHVSLVVAEPAPAYYLKHYDFRPGLRLPIEALAGDYWEALSYEPLRDPTGAIAYTADVVVVVGSTSAWAVWGQRDWDLVLVHTAAGGGPWLDVGVPFVPAARALYDFTDPERSDAPLTGSDRARFLANFGR
jgi:hypothetical protein